jgi:hypothetical protein
MKITQPNRPLAYQLATAIPNDKLEKIAGGRSSNWSVFATFKIIGGRVTPDLQADG